MTLVARIKEFNKLYKLPVLESPGIPDDLVDNDDVISRIEDFSVTLRHEVAEGEDICTILEEESQNVADPFSFDEDEARLEVLTALADWYGDMIVYCLSEATKFGIPIDEVLEIIMDSNMSKLGADGQPIYDTRGKVMKGPNYWKPEPKIKALLFKRILEAKNNPAQGNLAIE